MFDFIHIYHLHRKTHQKPHPQQITDSYSELETPFRISIICFCSYLEFSLTAQEILLPDANVHTLCFSYGSVHLLFGMFETLSLISFVFFKECETRCLPGTLLQISCKCFTQDCFRNKKK